MKLRPTLLLASALALLPACVINGDAHPRPRDLEPAWLVTKPRLLGVRATPAEARPGETVTFEALLADPTEAIDTVLWIACPPADADGVGAGCIDEEQTVIGFEPLQAPVLEVADDLLDGLDEAARQEGLYVLVQVTGLPPIDPEEIEEGFDFGDVDFNEVEAGYKRLVVSEASTPNANPEIATMTVEGQPLPDGAVLEVDAGEPYEIGLFLTDASLEQYEYLNSAGEVELRSEEPYVAWYATAGQVVEPATLHPFLQSTWIAPAAPGEVTIWAVVRDRRGGQHWRALSVRVR